MTNISQGSTGDSYIFLKEFEDSGVKIRDFLTNLADSNSADVTTKHDNHKEVLRYEQNNCDACTYVIGVKADRKTSFSFTINLDGDTAQIQNNK